MTLPLNTGAGPAPRAPGVTNQGLAQAIYLAQLSAVKGNCQCNTCKIMRRASDTMIARFVNRKPEAPAAEGVDQPGGELDIFDENIGGGDT